MLWREGGPCEPVLGVPASIPPLGRTVRRKGGGTREVPGASPISFAFILIAVQPKEEGTPTSQVALAPGCTLPLFLHLSQEVPTSPGRREEHRARLGRRASRPAAAGSSESCFCREMQAQRGVLHLLKVTATEPGLSEFAIPPKLRGEAIPLAPALSPVSSYPVISGPGGG